MPLKKSSDQFLEDNSREKATTELKIQLVLKIYIHLKPMVKELVVKYIKTKLNIIVKLTIINLSKINDDGKPDIKPHHLTHNAKPIPLENWFDRVYEDLWETLFSKLVRVTTKESGWALLSIDHTDIHLSNYEQQGGHQFNPLPTWIKNSRGLINPKIRITSIVLSMLVQLLQI